MTVTPSIDPAEILSEHLAQASRDLLRELLSLFLNALLSGPERRSRLGVERDEDDLGGDAGLLSLLRASAGTAGWHQRVTSRGACVYMVGGSPCRYRE